MKTLVEAIISEFSAKLLNEWNFQEYKFRFDLSSIYTLDLDSKAKWDNSRLENGVASVNDLRRESDIEPIEKGDDVYLSVNFAPLGSAKLSGEVAKSE